MSSRKNKKNTDGKKQEMQWGFMLHKFLFLSFSFLLSLWVQKSMDVFQSGAVLFKWAFLWGKWGPPSAFSICPQSSVFLCAWNSGCYISSLGKTGLDDQARVTLPPPVPLYLVLFPLTFAVFLFSSMLFFSLSGCWKPLCHRLMNEFA